MTLEDITKTDNPTYLDAQELDSLRQEVDALRGLVIRYQLVLTSVNQNVLAIANTIKLVASQK